MTEYDPTEAIEDQAADAMRAAISMCREAGWSAADVARLVSIFFKVDEPALAAKEGQADG